MNEDYLKMLEVFNRLIAGNSVFSKMMNGDDVYKEFLSEFHLEETPFERRIDVENDSKKMKILNKLEYLIGTLGEINTDNIRYNKMIIVSTSETINHFNIVCDIQSELKDIQTKIEMSKNIDKDDLIKINELFNSVKPYL